MPGLAPKLPLSIDNIDGHALIKSYNELVTQNLKNLIPLDFENNNKPNGLGQHRDNLKTTSDKDYGEPL